MNNACKTLIEALSYNLAGDLTRIQFPEKKLPPPPSDYCQSRSKLFDLLTKKSFTEAAFAQCLKEVENGCSECNLAPQYQTRHFCPLFQHKVAEFYRHGRFVPANVVIAHNWDLMASRQGYEPSMRQVADDLIVGDGCTRDAVRGAELLADFAERGDHECACKVVELAENGVIDPRMGARYLLMLANSDDADSAQWKSRVANCFAMGRMGFPTDDAQRVQWELMAAESGNVDIIGRIARRYYDEGLWPQALRWYNRLQEACDEDYSNTIDEIFGHCIMVEGLTPQQQAEKGRKLYLGLDCEEDQPSAFRYFSVAAEAGNAMALRWLGICYAEGKCVVKDEEMADSYHRQAAEAGNVDSMVYLYEKQDDQDSIYDIFYIIDTLEDRVADKDIWAMFCKSRLLFKGKIFEQDKEATRDLLSQLVNIDDDPQFIGRRALCENELGDRVTAYHNFLLSASRGDLESQYRLGICYYRGEGAPRYDYAEAFKWFSRSAQRGHKMAQWMLYECYANGQGVEKNMTLANQWCLKAAEQGVPEAERRIGHNYYVGDGIAKNYVEARKWYLRATEHGYRKAFFLTAYMLHSGEGGLKDYAKAFSLYTDLAESGNRTAMNNLACMYNAGEGTAQNTGKAAHWYLKAAEAGVNVAQCNLANHYLDGAGVEQDYEKARCWYEKSLENGYSHAAYFLARLYRYGKGVEKDMVKAIEYYKQAIAMPHSDQFERRGYDAAIIELANLYYSGNEVDRDYAKAFSLYKQAAEANLVSAFFKLGYCYEYSYGTQKDIELAVFWYRKAAAESNADAKKRLDALGYDYVEPDNDDSQS